MKTGLNGINTIKKFEGCFLHAYKCPAAINTIGYGTIKYPNGNKVKIGDVITQAQADEYLMHEVNEKAGAVANLLKGVKVNQNQFDALVSFAYNLGTYALQTSTLLKKVRSNPNDPAIRTEFMKWCKARQNGKLVTLNGLLKRRKEEADLYFKPIQ